MKKESNNFAYIAYINDQRSHLTLTQKEKAPDEDETS